MPQSQGVRVAWWQDGGEEGEESEGGEGGAGERIRMEAGKVLR